MKLFLLHVQYIEHQIELVCKNEAGVTQRVVVDDWWPWFYCKDDIARVRRVLGAKFHSAKEVRRIQFVGFTNEKQCNYLKVRVKKWPLYLKKDDLQAFEHDLKPHTKFLCETGLRSGSWFENTSNNLRCSAKYLKPLLDDTTVPKLTVCAWDLETTGLDPHKDAIHQVCCVFWDSSQALASDERSVVICSQPTTTERETHIVQADNEKDLLLKFIALIRKHDPDILTGYNTNSFDQKFLQYRLQLFGLTETCHDIGRGDKAVFKDQLLQSSALGANQQTLWLIPGRITIDLFMFCKVNFPTLPNFKLDTAAQTFIGDQKVSEIFK